jgi:hypothetical protein
LATIERRMATPLINGTAERCQDRHEEGKVTDVNPEKMLQVDIYPKNGRPRIKKFRIDLRYASLYLSMVTVFVNRLLNKWRVIDWRN